jgi:hypothetical protein
MDRDQPPDGVSAAYESWAPRLKPNGILALYNSNPREFAPGHDGHFRLRERPLAASDYSLIEEVGSTSFFRKRGSNPPNASPNPNFSLPMDNSADSPPE